MSLIVDVNALKLKQWSDGTVLFSNRSVDTLFLDPLAGRVLSILLAGCENESGLCEQISRELDIPVDDSITHYVETLLSRLRDLGLLIPAGLRPSASDLPPLPKLPSPLCELRTTSRRTNHSLSSVFRPPTSDLRSPPQVNIRIGRFIYSITIRIPEAMEVFAKLYYDYPAASADDEVDFYVSLDPYRSLRRPFRRRAVFSCDGVARFGPFPRQEALPYLEWGLNSCVARWSPYHLMMHAGTVAHKGEGIVLAGASGSGKSTLVAAFMQRGYRLLSDEFALVRLEDGLLDPMVRPICVKNEMIQRMRDTFPSAVLGPESPGERKGIVAHMKPPVGAVKRMDEPASPADMIFVEFREGASPCLESLGKAEAMKRAVAHCFNYKQLGERGFILLAETIDRCKCHALTFGDAFEAVELLGREFDHG